MKKNIAEAERMARTATVPEGWTIEPMEGTGYVVVTASNGARFPMATIDVGARVVRLGGYMTHGVVIGLPVERGRGWRQRLVDDAVAKLREVTSDAGVKERSDRIAREAAAAARRVARG